MACFRVDYCGRGELADRQQKLNQFLSKLTHMAEEFNVCVLMVLFAEHLAAVVQIGNEANALSRQTKSNPTPAPVLSSPVQTAVSLLVDISWRMLRLRGCYCARGGARREWPRYRTRLVSRGMHTLDVQESEI